MAVDVEVGPHLPGGIDSAAVVAIAREGGLERTFSLAIGDDPPEARNAAKSPILLGVKNICREPEGELNRRLIKLIHALEVPKINRLQVSQLAAIASRHEKVALSGLGGDVLFYGDTAHQFFHLAARTEINTGVCQPGGRCNRSRTSARDVVPALGEAERAARMLENMGAWPQVCRLLRIRWDNNRLRRFIYGPELLDA